MFKILDCTLRDGGYYTNWDFNKELVTNYLQSLNSLPIEYIEVGYRSNPVEKYFGKYFYSPVYELQQIRDVSNKKLVIILDEKDVRIDHLESLLRPIVGLVDMIRIALDPKFLVRALKLAEEIKKFGFEVGFNVMYMSKWKEQSGFIQELTGLDGLADYFYMVDSYGGVFPEDVKETMDLVRAKTTCKLGFHGHNNLEMALVNTLTAIDYGVDIVDSTILGMGRGAGNLKTELLLSVMSSRFGEQIDFNSLGNVVNDFNGLLEKYQWGTNLPYMISGSNSLPQKDVMDWYVTKRYPLNSMVRALQNTKNNIKDNEQFPEFVSQYNAENVIIVGGGPNAKEHSLAVKEFIRTQNDVSIVHASSKYSYLYKEIDVPQYYCLVGNEGHRLEDVFKNLGDFNGHCVLPPFPRKMGTYVPDSIHAKCFELPLIEFTVSNNDTHTSLALQTALSLKANNIFLVGYDGYQEDNISQQERVLTDENESIFKNFQEKFSGNLVSLTPTKYQHLLTRSIYSYIA